MVVAPERLGRVAAAFGTKDPGRRGWLGARLGISRLTGSGVGTMTDRRGGWGKPLSRRTFIKAAGGTGSGFVLYAYLPGGTKQALAQIPGGTLDPAIVPKYVTPLLIPPVMPRAATITMPGRQAGGLLRDLDAAVRAADPACGSARHDGVGVRRRHVGEQAEGC